MSIEINVNEPEPEVLPKKTKVECCIINYTSLRNFTDEPPQQHLLPGLSAKVVKPCSQRIRKEQMGREQPKLLTTAKQYLKDVYDESFQDEIEASNHLGLSSLLNSREVTPINPVGPNIHRKKNMSNRNKVHSTASELFSIPSNAEDKTHKFKNPEFRLFDFILGQGEVVYKKVFGKTRTINPKVIQMWKDCLSHEDKSEIFLPVGEESVQIPYTNARIYPLDKIEKEFKHIYGTGRNRALTAGEEAVIVESIRRYLTLCLREPLKIGRKDFDILEDILRDCKLSELQNFPFCMKQAETHFKLMATKWKYSGQLHLNDKIVETALIMGKNNFLDLARHNILTQYLLANSNVSDF